MRHKLLHYRIFIENASKQWAIIVILFKCSKVSSVISSIHICQQIENSRAKKSNKIRKLCEEALKKRTGH